MVAALLLWRHLSIRVQRANHVHVHALGEVLGRVDTPQRRLARALPLAVRVLLRVAELEGEVHRHRLEARLVVAGHVRDVLVEPRVPAREHAHRQRAEGEVRLCARLVRRKARGVRSTAPV